MLRSLISREGRCLAPALAQTTSTSWMGLIRLFQASTPPSMPDVFVPSMGDSISEGTVAAILKAPGDAVKVDEIIAQVETDKVTIDIKSTEAGIVEKVVVAAGAIVKPGDLVASVSKGASATPSTASPAATSAAAPSPAPQAPSSHPGAHTPRISFPPRIAPSGERISSLPAAQQDEILGLLAGSRATPASKPAAPTAAIVPTAAAAAAPAAKAAKVQTTILKEAPARRQMSQREIDFINSGGAP